MKRFSKKNKQSGVDQDFVQLSGTLVSFNTTAKLNENGNSYHRFTANVKTPNGESLIGGHVYQGLLPYIVGIPAVGTELDFVSLIEDLQSGHNSRWNIGGHAISSADDILGML